MTFNELMQTLRQRFSFWWMVLAFGAIYLISQTTIGVLLDHLGPEEIGKLQITGFTANAYIDTFQRWEASGAMPFYRAHFLADGIHWLWYTLLLLAMLALALERANAPARYNGVLILPLIAGPCDALENTIQHIFLSEPGYAAIVDPLPLISTLASITKWSLLAVTLLVLAALIVKTIRKGVTS